MSEPQSPGPAASEAFAEGPSPEELPVVIGLFDVLGFSKRLERLGLQEVLR
jgi:hypothetical protein